MGSVMMKFCLYSAPLCKGTMKILFLIPYPPEESPSQRFRFEQYFPLLLKSGHFFEVQSFLTGNNWKLFYSKGRVFQKCISLLTGFTKRIGVLFTLRKFDFVFIHREVTPIGPPIFEWTIAKIFQKKIIYDFDDSIWLTDKTNESRLEKLLRCRNKVGSICKWGYKVSCGNLYLSEYARRFNKSVVLNPTTIDTESLHNPEVTTWNRSDDRIIIGWTGSHSTLKYLHLLEPVLLKLEKDFSHVRFLVIADRKPVLSLQRLDFLKWSKETEAEDLRQMDIGVMPLPDDEWAKGKCGFKALQYMSMEIPCVISPVGVNTIIVEHGVTGFLANNETEWQTYATRLIEDKLLREQIGKAGRKKVIDNYSIRSNQRNFLSLFE